jgi:RNA polymerase sigma-70 factor (ECF subfamily)
MDVTAQGRRASARARAWRSRDSPWVRARLARVGGGRLSQIDAIGHFTSVADGSRAPRRGRTVAPLGDIADFEQLYFRLSQRLLVFLTRRTADPHIATDLWSEAWAQAYEGRDRCRGATHAEQEAWVFGIARNVLASFYRRGVAEHRALERLELERPVLEDDDLQRLERLAELQELRTVVAEALGELSEDQRAAVRLRVVDRLGYSQVADRLGVSEQTARARVSRGLRALAEVLETAGRRR